MFLILILLILIAIGMIPFIFIPLSAWFWFLWAILGIIIGILLFVLLVLIFFSIEQNTKPTNKFKHFILRNACWLWIKFYHIDLKVIGIENLPKEDEKYTIYANHKSNMDPVLIYYGLNRIISAIGKKSLFEHWFMKMLQKTYGAVAIDRDNDRAAVKSILLAIKEVNAGLPIIIFPEGGIKSRQTEDMVNLRAGAYKLATKSEAKIVPISIVGSSECSKVRRTKKKIIKLVIHSSISNKDYKDMNTTELGLMVEDIINKGVHNAQA